MAAKKRRPSARPEKTAAAPAPAAPRSRYWMCAALIAAAGMWAYGNSLNGVFVLDDVRAIVQNETIRSLGPAALSPPPRSTVSGRPLSNLTFAVNYAVSALDTRSYHIVNIGIHVCAALALFGVVRRTLLTPVLRDRFGSSATILATVVAAIWVVHPLTTAAVTYIVQRVESLMSLFYLLTLYCAIRALPPKGGSYEKEPRVLKEARVLTEPRILWLPPLGGRLWALAAMVSCALGMATKEVMVTAPVAVLLWDVVFRRGERIRWGLLGGLAATWIVFAVLIAGEQREASTALTAGMSWRYLLTQSDVLLRYLRLAFFPSPLIFLYTWPLAASIGEVMPSALVITALLGLTVFGLWKRRPLAYAGACFFLILAPTSSVIPIVTEVAAEHRMYLPLAAVVAAVTCVVFALILRTSAVAASRAVAVAGLALVIALGLTTRARNSVYASEQEIWRDTVDKDPANPRARLAYGTSLGAAGHVPEAMVQFQRAVDLNDADAIAHARLGSAQAAQGNFDAAVPHLQRALSLDPGQVEAHKTLGQIYALRREDAPALLHLRRALDVRRDDPQLLLQLASVLADSADASLRDPPRALQYAEEAVRLTSRQEATALDVLGLAYARNGRLDDAIGAAREALAIARAAGDDAARGAIEARLAAYEARKRAVR